MRCWPTSSMPRSSSDTDIWAQHGTLICMGIGEERREHRVRRVVGDANRRAMGDPVRPFDDDDLNSHPGPSQSQHTRDQQKRKVKWDPDPGEDQDGLRTVRGLDAVQSVRARFEDFGMPLHDAQFADVADSVLPWAESVRTKAEYDSLMRDVHPRNYVTQKNWRRGVGGGPIERNFSPRARAQGHLAAGVAMFLAASPPLAERPNVTRIRY
jgi:hypothetical protein